MYRIYPIQGGRPLWRAQGLLKSLGWCSQCMADARRSRRRIRPHLRTEPGSERQPEIVVAVAHKDTGVGRFRELTNMMRSWSWWTQRDFRSRITALHYWSLWSMKIAVIGTGYGPRHPAHAFCRRQGHHVICVDNNIEKLDMLRPRQNIHLRAGLPDLLLERNTKQHHSQITRFATPWILPRWFFWRCPHHRLKTAVQTWVMSLAWRNSCRVWSPAVIVNKAQCLLVLLGEKVRDTLAQQLRTFVWHVNPEFLRRKESRWKIFWSPTGWCWALNLRVPWRSSGVYDPLCEQKSHLRNGSPRCRARKYAANAYLATHQFYE